MKERALASGCAGFFSKTDPAEAVLDAIRGAIHSAEATHAAPDDE
jgi:hypothetical protein